MRRRFLNVQESPMNWYKVVEHIEGFVSDKNVAGHVLYHRCWEDDY